MMDSFQNEVNQRSNTGEISPHNAYNRLGSIEKNEGI